MKLACSSSAYDSALHAGTLDLRGWLRLCAGDLEVDGVSIAVEHVTATDAAELRDIKKLCIDLHLTIASLSVATRIASPEQRAAEVERVRGWCDVAAYLGAPILTITTGALPQQRTIDAGRIVGFVRRVFGETPPNVRRAWSDVMWALRACADHGANRGVAIAARNERGGLIDAPHQLWQCVRDVGSPWLRACADPGLMRDRSSLDLPLQYAAQVDATLGDVREDGSDGATHWHEVLRLLRSARYRGFVTMGYAGQEAPETAMPRAARHMRGLLHLLGRQEMLRSANEDARAALPEFYRVGRPAADAPAPSSSEAEPVAVRR